ncbi:exonuclease domain-containing protein [Anaerotignum sp.]
MKYIILDLEWNQAIKKLHLYLEGEIIQIGAVKLDESFKKIETFKIGIAPKYYKKLHWKVAELTHISEADFAYGFSFPTAFRYFKDWCGDEFTLLTWGNDDLRILRANLNLYKLDPNWIPAAYNLQLIFDRQIAHENRQCSLLYAMEKINKVPLEAHDALHDALNTYEVCQTLDLNRAFADYSSYRKKKITPEYPNVAGQTSDAFIYPSKKTAFKATSKQDIFCPCCNKTMDHMEWISQNDIKYISLAKCTCGHEYFIRMKIKKTSANKYAAPMFIYQLDPQLTAYYIEKRLKKLPKIAMLSKNILSLPEFSTVHFSFTNWK